MKSVKLKYGMKDEQLVHISDVDSGLACGCTCVSCGESLVAKKGQKRENHFAHSSGKSCAHAVETAIHLAAKEILDQYREIKLPPVSIRFETNRASCKISDEKLITIDSLKIEKGVNGLVPDLIATVHGRDLFVEVFVTHSVDERKKKKIEELGVSAIEIDLSNAPRDMSKDALKELVINSVDNKKWIYNARGKHEFQRMLRQTRPLEMTPRGFASHIDHCPIKARTWRGKAYANFIDDCVYCEHCVDVSEGNVMCNGHIPSDAIYKPSFCS
ncbi:hypothetical protein CGI93_17625 [Vibrio parahaemolyticus]|uniref:competence protein CoiA family protein n=1 Tax=Vibrio parahaemolyticus TaxID=670 RepID=UPI001122CDA9|nr:competence protein CoiA family protein [Vibrio parahaemolyticus]TOG82168.1 hypothetical protein CGI93_17625 [Vibrio parahaemolyticus]